MDMQNPLVAAITSYILKTYGEPPEYPWLASPENAVFRHHNNRKWFALFLPGISKERLGLPGGGSIDILNLKCGPLLTGSLLQDGHILPGYHMNKEHWISIPLNGSLPQDELFHLIDLSFELTRKKL